MFKREGASEFVIPTTGNDELHLVGRCEQVKIGGIEAAAFARVWTFHVHNPDDTRRKHTNEAFPARFDQNPVAAFEQARGQSGGFALQQRLSAGDLDQAHRSTGAGGRRSTSSSTCSRLIVRPPVKA